MPGTIEELAQRLDLNALARDYPKKTSEKDYVYVDGENMQTPPSTSGSEDSERYSETLSIESTERWEKELLEDPKVWTPIAEVDFQHQLQCHILQLWLSFLFKIYFCLVKNTSN